MNWWKKLPKEKRDQLVLVVLVTAVALGGLGFGLIRFQYNNLRRINTKEKDAVARLEKMKSLINREDEIAAELAEASRSLAGLEESMATGDPYSWGLDLVRRSRVAHHVDVPVVNQPVVADMSLLPKFPYKQATFTLSGTGYYHDIGKFVADFENQFPQIRVVHLVLNPAAGLVSDDKEKLEFKLDIVALLRPNPS